MDSTTTRYRARPTRIRSASDGEVEALSLAVPTDRGGTPEPIELAKLITGTWGLVESARLEDWEAVDATLERIKAGTPCQRPPPRPASLTRSTLPWPQ